MTGVLFDYKGHTLPARKSAWWMRAGCGCYCAVVLAELGDEVLATPDQAWRQLEPNAEKRRRDQAAGHTVEIGPANLAVNRMKGGCPHTPRWGREPIPQPAGYVWADCSDPFRGRGRARSHLIVERGLDQKPSGHDRPEKFTALCGKTDWLWAGGHRVEDVPECSTCMKRAQKLVDAA